jgi:trehalose 6-phosphate synthase
MGITPDAERVDGPGAARRGYRFLLVAHRLPIDRMDAPDGRAAQWQRSPGGLVTALTPAARRAGAWVGWAGSGDQEPPAFDAAGIRMLPVPLTDGEVEGSSLGFAQATLWPLYHDVIVAPQFHRHWWEAYSTVNERFAAITADHARRGATVWVHDYQLQLVPALLRRRRPDLRIGYFHHVPFPGHEIFAQLPWRRQILLGLLGADLIGFQRSADRDNFLRACRGPAGPPGEQDITQVPPRPEAAARSVRVGVFPLSVDAVGLGELACRADVSAEAVQIRADLGDPRTVLLGVDRLDYTKGILHRLKAYEELLASGLLGPPETVFVQVAAPSRERVTDYRVLRHDVERVVGRINGIHATLGHPAVHYLHRTYSRQALAALYRASDVMLVTPLRDGMNLVAKEYVACRHDESGALVLSEFTGAAEELGSAFLVNPHDIDGLKAAMLRACRITPREARRRMRSMRRRVRAHDVTQWAASFLDALDAGPDARGTSPVRAATRGRRLDVPAEAPDRAETPEVAG